MSRQMVTRLIAAQCEGRVAGVRRSLVAFALSVVGLLALSPGVALARLVSFGSFPVPAPIGVAVDQSGGSVFVTTDGPQINEFDASIPPNRISPPSPFGSGTGPAWHAGAAVNPVNHDVYVVDAFGHAIQTYAPGTGALLSSFEVPGSANVAGVATIVQIAADSAGNVYVPNAPNNEVEEFSESEVLNGPPGAPPINTFTGSGSSALSGPTGVAIDPAGNVWVADMGNNRVEEFAPTGAFITAIASEGVLALAVDSSDDVYALVRNDADFCGSLAPPCDHVVEYSSAGVKLADIGGGTIAPGPPHAVGGRMANTLAVNDATGRVYVTDGGEASFTHNAIRIYGPPLAPVVGRELAVDVTSSEAKLGALVNAGGADTTYRFEYGTTSAYGQAAPFPEGDVGTGVTPRTVWAATVGLAPGSTYHYRVVAANEVGPPVYGPDETFTTQSAAEAGCPNEQFRIGFSADLPDCRAYELVTPPTKDSTQPDLDPASGYEFGTGNQTSREGDRFSYFSFDSLPGSDTDGKSYLSTRTESGWASEDVIPLQPYMAFECPIYAASMPAYSIDLSRGVLSAGGNQRSESARGGGCGAEEAPPIVSGEPQGVENLFVRDNTTAQGAYQLVDLTPPGVTPADAHFDGASADLGHVVFDEHAQLTPDAPPGVDDLYEWSGGVVRLVTVLPGGAPVVGSLAETDAAISNGQAQARAISADGSRVLFTAGGNLYARLNGSSTVQVDASQAGGSGGGGRFLDASTDGSLVFFTDGASAGLTSDTVPGSGQNLYRYDVASGQLSDLTPQAAAEVAGVSGVSEDGSYVYFLANGALAPGATAGQPNLYRSRNGTTTLIATLSPEDGCVTTYCARVSASGAFLAFDSRKSLTGYDNTDTETGNPEAEIFLYSAGANQVACASCNPSGEASAGGALMTVRPGGAPHYLADDGRVFFDTPVSLLPADTNGQTDVYEYEGGQLHLISSGTSSTQANLLDVSAEGNDVFFLTRQKLVPRDTQEGARSIYDARIGGGFPEPFSPPPCTTADACRTAVAPLPPVFGAPASATFSGAGNLTPPPAAKPAVKPRPKTLKCRNGLVKRKIKRKTVCVRNKARKASRSAHANRRGH